MCESGGNYSALNPSSGAGGAYQILPSTWELYGGKGEPAERSQGRTGPDRRRNLGRLRRQRLGLRLSVDPASVDAHLSVATTEMTTVHGELARKTRRRESRSRFAHLPRLA